MPLSKFGSEGGNEVLRRLANWIREVLGKLIPKKNAEQALHVEAQVPPQMSAAIELWKRLYCGKPPWLFDTHGNRDESVQTLGLAATVASKLAKRVTLEARAEVTGGARGSYLNKQLQMLWDDIRRYVEYAAAFGGVVFKPYPDGKELAVDVVMADAFLPTSFNNRGEVTAGVFAQQLIKGSDVYTKLEHHELTGTGYRIVNRAFVSRDTNELGREVSLASVEEWASLEPEATITGVNRPLFAYFRMPFANPVDPESPLGVSVYARAADHMRDADKQYSRILWEYEGSELAIDADATALLYDATRGQHMPERDKRLFRNTNFQGGGASGDFYKVFSPAIRDQSLFNGLNKLLQQIETDCGLSFGALSDPQNVDKTATEIRSSKQEEYTTVTDMQKALHTALDDLLYAMDIWTTAYQLAPAGAYELTIRFDDSLLNDPDVEKQQDAQEVRDGLLAKWEYRMKWRGEDEQTARRRVAELDSAGERVLSFGGDG